MRYDDNGAAISVAGQHIDYGPAIRVVQRCRRLIREDNGGAVYHRPGHNEPLPLSPRKVCWEASGEMHNVQVIEQELTYREASGSSGSAAVSTFSLAVR